MSGVLAPQHWPHSFLSLAYVSKERPYDELTLAEFAAGYASILKLNNLPPDKRSGHLDHFIVLMYLITQFPWPAIREFHVAVLFEIKCGRARWGDSFAHLELRLLCSTTKSSISSSRPSGAVLFCRDFQTEKCSHTKDHYGTICNKRWLAQHRPHRAPLIIPTLLCTLVASGVDFDPVDITFLCAFFLFARISNLVPESFVTSGVQEHLSWRCCPNSLRFMCSVYSV